MHANITFWHYKTADTPLDSRNITHMQYKAAQLQFLLCLRLGFVYRLQDAALHQCLPLSSVCCFPNPGGSLLLYVVLPSSAWSSSWSLPSPWLPLCAAFGPPILLHSTRLTWKPQIEKMERSSLQKLAQMRKLAGTSWGAGSSILTKVYTATVRPTMEYASTMWGTAAKTNKSRLDKIQNMALWVIHGAMKTTPVHDMEKTANVEPLDRRRSLKILIQGEELRRLPSHPLHTNLAQPTKNHLKRQSLNHQYKELSRTHQDIVDVPIELLTDPAWKPDR